MEDGGKEAVNVGELFPWASTPEQVEIGGVTIRFSDMKLRPYDEALANCLPVSFEYITGTERERVMELANWAEGGWARGLDWHVLASIAEGLGVRVRLLLSDSKASQEDERDAGVEVVGEDVLRQEIRHHPSVAIVEDVSLVMGERVVRQHALAYVGDCQVDPTDGRHSRNSSRNIISAIVFPCIGLDECMLRVHDASERWKQRALQPNP